MATTSPRRASQALRARSALLWGVVCFVLGQAGLLLLMETRFPQWRDPEYGLRLASLLARLRERSPGTPLVLALGTSRVAMGIRPEAMAGVLASPRSGQPAPLMFNMAVNNGGTLIDLLNLRRLLKKGIRPRIVFLELHVPCLAREGPSVIESDSEMYLRRTFAHEVDVVARHSASPLWYVSRWLGNQFVPSHSYRSVLLALLARNWLPHGRRIDGRWRGFGPYGFHHVRGYERHLAGRFRKCESDYLLTRPAAAATYRITPTAEACLFEMHELCRREGIRLVLLRMPEAVTLRENWNPRVRLELEGLLDRLRVAYKVEFIDTQAWEPDEAFADLAHLSAEGARGFSHRFAHDVLVPMLDPGNGGQVCGPANLKGGSRRP